MGEACAPSLGLHRALLSSTTLLHALSARTLIVLSALIMLGSDAVHQNADSVQVHTCPWEEASSVLWSTQHLLVRFGSTSHTPSALHPAASSYHTLALYCSNKDPAAHKPSQPLLSWLLDTPLHTSLAELPILAAPHRCQGFCAGHEEQAAVGEQTLGC